MGEDCEASMKREQDPRIGKAFRAMKNIGIKPERVKPVLRNLLKLYGSEWELIEADNYRTLADAIFEYENEQKHEKNNADSNANIECSFKEPNKGLPKKKASCTMDNSNLRMIEMPKRLEGPKLSETSQPSRRDQTAEPKHNESDPHQRNRSSREIRDHENGRKRPREEPLDCIPYSTLPSTCLSKGKYLEANGQASGSGTTTSDIASSKCGQARLSLSCKYDFGKSDFRGPDLDAVLKHADENLLKRYRISPKISVVELLRNLCDCYVEFSTNSGSRSVAQRQPVNHNGIRAVHTFFDITKGSENVKIMLLDKSGKESLPDFTYIRENTVYESAQIHASLARIADDDCCSSCSGDCLSSSIPCECARETGGEFAYTPEGLLTKRFLNTLISMGVEPQKHYQYYCTDCPLERARSVRWPEKCKGHPLRKFIKECWKKCGCSMLCGNRVVQRGITRNLQVFLAEEGKGWGLRTVEEIPEGSFICEYVGEILTNMELYERNQSSTDKGRHTYPVLLDADWGSENVLKDEEALCLDATNYGNVARFINHRCFDGNLLDIPVEVESPDHHYYHLAFFTKRKVEAFEELTWDYGIDFDDHSHPIKAFQCCCKSLYCRDKKGKRVQQ